MFDISKWDLRLLTTDAAERHEVLRMNDPKRGELAIEETASYDATQQVRHLTWYLSSKGEPDFRVIEYRLRVIFPQELLLLLDAAGFRLEARYGEFPHAPFDSASPRQVYVCLCK